MTSVKKLRTWQRCCVLWKFFHQWTNITTTQRNTSILLCEGFPWGAVFVLQRMEIFKVKTLKIPLAGQQSKPPEVFFLDFLTFTYNQYSYCCHSPLMRWVNMIEFWINLCLNRGCLGPSTLWEWANGDALYACMMVRNTLILPKLLWLHWSSYKLWLVGSFAWCKR